VLYSCHTGLGEVSRDQSEKDLFFVLHGNLFNISSPSPSHANHADGCKIKARNHKHKPLKILSIFYQKDATFKMGQRDQHFMHIRKIKEKI
jgi:hypothetical protein